MLEQFPPALLPLSRWVVWKYVQIPDRPKPTKVPYSPVTHQKASVTDPTHWSTADNAVELYRNNQQYLDGVGFTLGDFQGVPVVGTDFDNCIADDGTVKLASAEFWTTELGSYTEYSPSNTGLHTLTLGKLDTGVRKDSAGIELYGAGRYFTVTGRPYRNNPLVYNQNAIDKLYAYLTLQREQAQKPGNLDWTVPTTIEDQKLYEMAAGAANGEKFVDLVMGNWQKYYQSASEADFAICDIIAFYTDSPEQVLRCYCGTALRTRAGKFEKRQIRDYMAPIIARAFDRKLPVITIPDMPMAEQPAPVSHDFEQVLPEQGSDQLTAEELAIYTRPPGLVGDLASWMFSSAQYPMVQASLASALTLMAGIVGRQYQVSDTGCNIYTVVLARTGTGKEQISQGVGAVFSALRKPKPVFGGEAKMAGYEAAAKFRGPASLTGRGLEILMAESELHCCFSVWSEFNHEMQGMTKEPIQLAFQQLRKMLLDFYMKSGETNDYAGSKTSEKEKEIREITSPAFSFIAESTPDNFYSFVNPTVVSSGLIPRMIVFENHVFINANNNASDNKAVPPHILSGVQQLMAKVIHMVTNLQDMRQHVGFTPEADRERVAYRDKCRQIAWTKQSSLAELWSRVALNALKVAALVAIGVDAVNPVITLDILLWAQRLVEFQTRALIAKFEAGEVGKTTAAVEGTQSYDRAIAAMRKIMKAYVTKRTPDQWIALRADQVISLACLNNSCKMNSAFDHQRGRDFIIGEVLKILANNGEIKEVRGDGHRTGRYYKIIELH